MELLLSGDSECMSSLGSLYNAALCKEISINTLHAMGPYMGLTGWTHGKAKVTFSRWYSSKIVDCQQLIDYLAL